MGRIIQLGTRRFAIQTPTERDSIYVYKDRSLDLDKVALILIDVVDDHPIESYNTRRNLNVERRIIPLLALARKHNIKIFHAPHEYPIHSKTPPLPSEKVVYTGLKLHEYLGELGIDTLLYAGYALNWCVFHRPEGIICMKHIGYKIILLRDCTTAFETPESLDGEWALKIAINMVETQWGCTSTLDDLREALA